MIKSILLRKANSLLSILFSLMRHMLKSRERVDNACVLIIEWGNMGDTLIDAKTIIALAEHYTREGKKVVVAGTAKTKHALINILEMQSINFFIVEELDLTIKAIKKTLSGLEKNGYETIISMLPWSNWQSLYIPACLPCNESWGVFHKRKDNIILKVAKGALSNCYTNKIIAPIDLQQTQRNKIILREIGIADFETEIVAIPKKNEVKQSIGDYIVISVDSLDTARRWPTENFIELTYRLLDLYGFDVYLTGSNCEQSELIKYKEAFDEDNRVKITIGKLQIDEWVETIRNSQFVVSLDSGSTHIAAGVGTVCFCLTGVWDGHRIMPYAIDKKTPNTIEPICIYRRDLDVNKLPCYGCFAKRYFGWKNKECYKQVKNNHPCLCLEHITVDDVISKIESEIKDQVHLLNSK